MEKLQELEHKYFMLQMQDHWESEDYRYADELKEQIRKAREEDARFNSSKTITSN